MADSKVIKAIGADASYAKLVANEAMVIVIKQLFTDEERTGQDFPEGFFLRIENSGFNRLKPLFLRVAWAYYNMGMKAGLANASEAIKEQEKESLMELNDGDGVSEVTIINESFDDLINKPDKK